MNIYILKLSSKNLDSLQKTARWFKQKLTQSNYFFENQPKNKNRKKILTLLKSPHVNKTAQEQFEIRTFSRVFLIRSTKSSNFIYLFKKSKVLFPLTSIKVQFYKDLDIIGKKLSKASKIKLNNLRLVYKNVSVSGSVYKRFNEKTLLKTVYFLKLMDIYGEVAHSKTNV